MHTTLQFKHHGSTEVKVKDMFHFTSNPFLRGIHCEQFGISPGFFLFLYKHTCTEMFSPCKWEHIAYILTHFVFFHSLVHDGCLFKVYIGQPHFLMASLYYIVWINHNYFFIFTQQQAFKLFPIFPIGNDTALDILMHKCSHVNNSTDHIPTCRIKGYI